MQNSASSSRQTPFIVPVVLVAVGILLLLNNYLLLEGTIFDYWPLLFVLLGLLLLWRGDLALSWQAQTFGITRGTVQQAALEISSGEIDVKVRALQKSGRLIAGQYTARSRPALQVRQDRAAIVMRRRQTWLFSLADWEVGLAKDVPWTMLISTHLGQLDIDLRNIETEQAHIATGFGDIRIVCTEKVNSRIFTRSSFGDIRLIIPEGIPVKIEVNAGPLCRVLQHSPQFEERADHTVVSRAYRDDKPSVQIVVGATFGNIHLLSASAQAILSETTTDE